ncbi:MAG: spore maturation protein [Pelosinus sp.]|nr:spore maturation protein [Pelosinus sp.]
MIWLLLILAGTLYAALWGDIALVTQSAITAADTAVSLAFKLTGVMCLWLGMMRIAEKAGLIKLIVKVLQPTLRFIFPDIPKNHPALGAIILTLSANMLGMGNAVTPLGIKAMQELQKLNKEKTTATPSMCTLLVLCTAGFTLVPATVIALRTAAGSGNPTEIVGPTILVSLFATISVLFLDRICRVLFK